MPRRARTRGERRPELFVLGTSGGIATADERERLHLDVDELNAAVKAMRGPGRTIVEGLPLVTCYRTELYGVSEDPVRAIRRLRDLLARRMGVARPEVERTSYHYRGAEAVRHAFRVASGLESVVVGEAQILGQVRHALHQARSTGVAGQQLTRLFQDALAAGKRVRTEIDLGRGATSVVGAVLDVLAREVETFEDLRVVVLGAGASGTLAARLLRKRGVRRMVVVNRTVAKAEAVARELGVASAGLPALPALLADADVIVGSIPGRPELVRPDHLTTGDAAPGPRYLVDLAHPRCCDPSIRFVPGIRLIDLQSVFADVECALAASAALIPRAEAIVDEAVEAFDRWVRSRASLGVLRAMREHAIAVAESEAERRSRGRSEAERDELRRFAAGLARKLLHTPTVALRQADPSSPQGRSLVCAVTSLFGIDDPSLGADDAIVAHPHGGTERR